MTDKRNAEWWARMAVRQDPAQFDISTLINKLLGQHWMHECNIRKVDGRWLVSWTEAGGRQHFLRHSQGPGTGTFWDIYGDDFLSPELALVELSKAYPPPYIDCVIPTHGS